MTLHGEYKTPGGKLIAVEFRVLDNTLRDVVVTGDFFLYPEDALPLLAGALESSVVTLNEADYAAKVRSALGNDVELLGSSPEAIGAAIVRALQNAKGAETKDVR